jgi:membrane protease subunit (stomatin/prohibitin family)
MGTNNVFFLENIEWFDESGQEMVHRIPESGSGEIKWGAQLTVRESQAAVFFYKGRAVEVFRAGRHTLKTGNIPILTKIASLPWGLTSPLRAEIYFTNLKVFTHLKWGTRDPVAFKDSELGLIRLRAFGVFNLQIVQPALLVNRLVGTQGIYATKEIEDYLNQVIVSRLNDIMGEKIDTILNLPTRYDEMAAGLSQRLHQDFSHLGFNLANLYINAITPPAEVQQAIDERSRMGAIGDMNRFLQMKAAMALEKAAGAEGAAGNAMGLGVGFMMPAMLAQGLAGAGVSGPPAAAQLQTQCHECRQLIPVDARFCPMCGHQLVVFRQCIHCGKNLTPNANFCPRCGKPADDKPVAWLCGRCQTENLADAKFCNQCGEKKSEA